MNPAILEIIGKIVRSNTTIIGRAQDLAIQLGIPDADLVGESIRATPHILETFPPPERICMKRLHKIMLLIMVIFSENSDDVSEAIGYVHSAFEFLKNKGQKTPSVFDYLLLHIMDMVVGRLPIGKQCPGCPVKEKPPIDLRTYFDRYGA